MSYHYIYQMYASALANKIKKQLSSYSVTIVILIISIIGRLIQVLFFFNYRSDRSYQILATRNWLQGHGITIAQVFANDLSTTTYQPITEWPPGYTIIALPFYLLFSHNYMIAGLFLDMLSAVLLLVTSRGILSLLGATPIVKNLYTLIAGFFIYEFIFKSSSDLPAIALFILAIYCTLKILKGTNHLTSFAIAAGLSLCISGAIKFMFIPVALIVPVFLLLKSFFDKNNSLRKGGLISLIISIIGLSLVIIYQKHASGSAAKLYGSTYGFFPGNLLDTYPFLPASFLKPDTAYLLFGGRISPGRIMFVFNWINVIMLFGLITWIVIRFKRTGLRHLSVQSSFLYLSFLLSIAIVLLLVVLSVILKKIPELGSLWIYIQEPRYFGLIAILIQLLFFTFWKYLSVSGSLKLKSLFYCFFLLLLLEFCHGVVFDAIRIVKFGKEEYSWKSEDKLQKYSNNIIEKIKKETGVNNIVITSSTFYISNRISMYSHAPVLYEAGNINDITKLHSKKPAIVLAAIRKQDETNFHSFLSLGEKKMVGSYGDVTFYTLSIN